MSKVFLPSLMYFLNLLLSCFPFLVNSLSPLSEQAILLKIKQQWGNQSPLHLWNSTISHCDWPGIECTGGETVTEINLNSQNIQGTVPPFICDLINLTILDLGNNYIQGQFPTFLYNCTKLYKLDLSSNLFVGPLPNDINKLSPSLQHLVLSANNFTDDVPASLAQLKGLVTLHLDSNLFNGTLPSELGTLKQLEELVLAYNSFSPIKLPKEIGMLKNLKLLWMTQCNLIGNIPKELANLTSVEHLDLVNNNLMGEIPSGLFLLNNLAYLYLYKNQLSGKLPTKINALNLVHFDVSENDLSGTLTQGIGNLSKLQLLHLFQNQFSGTLPPELGFLPNLTTLAVSNNQFSGVIPLSFVKCIGVQFLSLYDNKFSGKIPDGLFRLPNIKFLLLRDNKFSGQLPSQLSEKLVRLDMSDNKLSGSIPSSISNCKNLIIFRATNNQFQGIIPVELTALSSLHTLLLNGNQLSGELPARIISWKSLETLNLANNNLSGPLPGALGSLLHLQNLDLSNNKLSGHIPPELAQLTVGLNFATLNLSFNNFSGKIPNAFNHWNFNFSFLGNHKLCSDIHVSDLPRCSSRNKYIVPVVVPGVVIISLFLCFIYSWITKGRQKENSNHEQQAWVLKSFHRIDFTETEIMAGLTDNNIIGLGGSGKVYSIIVNDFGRKVAVKKIINRRKLNGILEKQFLTEIEILGTVRHANLVKLFCCISSADVKLLVYEYMENQSLDKWIHKKRTANEPSSIGSPDSNNIMDWPTRLRVAIGGAKGLCYLHHERSPPIIHRDVKSSNILLDLEFNAKIADFGLAKMALRTGEPQTASAIAGSFGYIAPEYWQTRKVNEKIDVYSFGVVLLELATGRNPCEGNNDLNLADWSWQHCCDEEPIRNALDEDIMEARYMAQMENVFKLGLICTSKKAESRPSMKQVVQILIAYTNNE